MRTFTHIDMRFSGKAIVAALLLAMAVGCGETSEQFVVREAGLWNVVSHTRMVYIDDVLDSTFINTVAADLGQMQFDMSGQGFRLLPTHTDTFVWQLNATDDRLIVYYKIGPFMNAAITDQTDNAMTLSWENTRVEDTTEIKTEYISTIERAQ
jgi:hypothetical protein